VNLRLPDDEPAVADLLTELVATFHTVTLS
jgi:hypothetical protein